MQDTSHLKLVFLSLYIKNNLLIMTASPKHIAFFLANSNGTSSTRSSADADKPTRRNVKIYNRMSLVSLHLLQLPYRPRPALNCCFALLYQKANYTPSTAVRGSATSPHLLWLHCLIAVSTYCRQNRIQTIYNSLKYS